MVEKLYVTYNDVHNLCKESADRLLAEFRPQLIIAIGGGGYIPARILRSFLKKHGSPNIPIQAIGLSLYERLGGETNGSNGKEEDGDSDVETPGTTVTRTQWLDFSALGHMRNLVGKRILIVDEVDDTRTTLEYAVRELEKDVEEARGKMNGHHGHDMNGADGNDVGSSNGDGNALPKTEFSIFVLHNKDKTKRGRLPPDLMRDRYYAARTVEDVWINYPWEATNIEEHDEKAMAGRKQKS